MASNLTNVYVHLRSVYQSVDILFAKPVSYIKTLAVDEKVIFVYKEVRVIVFGSDKSFVEIFKLN